MTAAETSSPSRKVAAPSDTSSGGAAFALTLSLGAVAGAVFLRLAGVLQWVYPASAVVVGLYLLSARRWYSFTAFTLVLWVVAPEVRRILDWQSSYQQLSLVVATPALVSLTAVPWAVLGRRRVRTDVAAVFGVTATVMAYAFLVGVLRNGFKSAAADVILYVAPLVLGLFMLTVLDDNSRTRCLLGQFAALVCLLVGGYAILQFFLLPPWDAAWIIESKTPVVGIAQPQSFRVFGTFTTTGPLGQVLAASLLILLAERRASLRTLATVCGLVALGLTLVRAGWLGFATGVFTLVVLGRRQGLRLVATVAVIVATLALVGSPILQPVQDRLRATLEAGTTDVSFATRVGFQGTVAGPIIRDVTGVGMGATGRAVVASGQEAVDPRIASYDSGIFESLARYGSLCGLVFLLALGLATYRVVRRARHASLFDACCAAALVALVSGMIFTDMTRGIFGVLLWFLLAVQGQVTAPVERASGNEHAPPTGT